MEGALVNLLPDLRLPRGSELPLGAHVRYSHRAAVARWRPEPYMPGGGSWWLTEGVDKRSGWRPVLSAPTGDRVEDDLAFGFTIDPWYHRGPGALDPNKTVVVWPEEGEAILFGLVRRGIGRSYSATGRSSSFEDNFDPGGFGAQAFLPLYALKHELSGVGYILTPTWATEATPA